MEDDDLAVYAQPLSSDEEAHILPGELALGASTVPRGDETESRPRPKRPAHPAPSTRPKRRKLRDEPTLDTFLPPDNPTAPDSLPEWSSSGSQKRRLHRSYANRKYFVKPEAIERRPKALGQEQGFVSHTEVDKHDDGPISSAAFIPVEPTPFKRTERKRPVEKHVLYIPDIPKSEARAAKAEFCIPDLPDFSSSAATPGTDLPAVYDQVLSPDVNRHARSGSTSSLSSVDDIFLLKHNDEFRTESEPTAELRCPMCGNLVKDSISLLVPNNLRTLNFQKLQNFCAQHKTAEAREIWDEAGYPDIDWDELETVRIPKKVADLERVISRETPSFYLDVLESKITAAKGDRKAIKGFLNQGVVDIAKPGYYGPKGTRIMVNAIIDILSRTLNKALQRDSALRAAGVGGYVSTVLVPELTLHLVMEDMNLQSGDQGRIILEKSTEIGMLLNPDDEHLERQEGD